MQRISEWSSVGGISNFTTKSLFIPTTEKAQINSGEPSDGFGSSIAMSLDEQWLFVTSYQTRKLHIFKYNGSNYVPFQSFTNGVSGSSNNKSVAVSDDGETVVTTLFESKELYIYKYDGSQYNEFQVLTLSNTGNSVNRRVRIDGSGDRILVSETQNAAQVHLYKFNGTNYVVEKIFTPTNSPTQLHYYGYYSDISKDGLRCVIGAYGVDTGQVSSGNGLTYIYKYNGTAWVEEFKARFIDNGQSVSISRDGLRIVVGRPNGTTYYSPYYFKYESNQWIKQGSFPNPGSVNQFGTIVELNHDGNKCAVVDRNNNKTYFYIRNSNGTWQSAISLSTLPSNVTAICINVELTKIFVGLSYSSKVYLYE